MKVKKVPLRMCLGCQEMKPKKELVRVVRSPEGEISLDPTGKRNGRGAYICRQVGCLEKAVKAKRFEKAFEHPMPDGIFEILRAQLGG
ncbi:MAG TPA: YlxR family protein [Verrucomicrobiae bacterium]|nr:YlxR family protein [Verrucomicrobiae bacterium]